MHIRIKTLATLLLICTSVSAQFRTVQLAHEIPLSEFVTPVTQNGMLSYRACRECETRNSRLTVNTRYIIDDQEIALTEFRERLLDVSNREDRSLTVLQHLETNTVTSISIRL